MTPSNTRILTIPQFLALGASLGLARLGAVSDAFTVTSQFEKVGALPAAPVPAVSQTRAMPADKNRLVAFPAAGRLEEVACPDTRPGWWVRAGTPPYKIRQPSAPAKPPSIE